MYKFIHNVRPDNGTDEDIHKQSEVWYAYTKDVTLYDFINDMEAYDMDIFKIDQYELIEALFEWYGA